MWIASTTGFLSAVQHRDDPRLLVVRARVKADLEPLRAFVDRAEGAPPEVLSYQFSDYPWRVIAHRALVAAFVAEAVQAIDYGNYKDAVAERQGKPRAAVYGRVWGAMLDLERLDPDRRPLPTREPWYDDEPADDVAALPDDEGRCPWCGYRECNGDCGVDVEPWLSGR